MYRIASKALRTIVAVALIIGAMGLLVATEKAYGSQKASTPQNLKAKAVSPTEIKISWDESSHARSYTVYRATSAKGKFKKVAVVKAGSPLSFSDKNKKTGKKYYYRVIAFGKKGFERSRGSAIVSATARATASQVKKALKAYALQTDWIAMLEKHAASKGYWTTEGLRLDG